MVRRYPAEWEPQDCVWLAWPSQFDLWQKSLPHAQREVASLIEALTKSVRVHLLCFSDQDLAQVSHTFDRVLAQDLIRAFKSPYGDIWLRDTGPVFVESNKQLNAARFEFNGWGNKFVLDFDREVSRNIASLARLPDQHFNFVFEGGSLDTNGQGLALTTRQCLLNPNRNPQPVLEQDWNERMRSSLGIHQLIWIERGLDFDHTDGHVDNIARFVGEKTVVCMSTDDSKDPQRKILWQIQRDLERELKHKAPDVDVLTIPSPGPVFNQDEELMPASYINFLISNGQMIVPIYGTDHDHEALELLQSYCPQYRVTGLRANHILEGGGSFHCISQQQPRFPFHSKEFL